MSIGRRRGRFALGRIIVLEVLRLRTPETGRPAQLNPFDWSQLSGCSATGLESVGGVPAEGLTRREVHVHEGFGTKHPTGAIEYKFA